MGRKDPTSRGEPFGRLGLSGELYSSYNCFILCKLAQKGPAHTFHMGSTNQPRLWVRHLTLSRMFDWVVRAGNQTSHKRAEPSRTTLSRSYRIKRYQRADDLLILCKLAQKGPAHTFHMGSTNQPPPLKLE